MTHRTNQKVCATRVSGTAKITAEIAAMIVPMIAAIAVLITAAIVPAAAKTSQAPGSRVSMDLPDAFKPSPLFAGFMEIISSAAVIILEIPATEYDRIAKGFTAEALAAKDITNVKPGKLDRADTHLYLTGEQKHPRATFEKHILVIKDATNAAVITFNIPKGSFDNGSISRAQVIKAMTSAKLEVARAPSRDLFTLGYLGPFEQTGAPTGTSRIFAEKGDTSPNAIRNIMAIAPSLNRLPVSSIKEFSEYAIQSLDTAKDLKITATRDVRIDSMSGHEITATALRGDTKTPVVIRQLILLPAPGGYFRLLTVTRAADEARLGPEIGKVFASFKATEASREIQ